MNTFTCQVCGKAGVTKEQNLNPPVCLTCLPEWAAQQERVKKAVNTCEPMAQGSAPSLDKDIYRAEANLEQLNRFKALREAARPLMEFLAQSGHPHHTALVDVTGVRIVEDQVSVKF